MAAKIWCFIKKILILQSREFGSVNIFLGSDN